MRSFKIGLQFERGYVAHPYWPEREMLINIQKASGLNRVRSEEKRDQALGGYLAAHDMTHEDYESLRKKADQPFYTRRDVGEGGNGHGPGEIVVPAHQLYGCLAQACDLAGTAIRIAKRENLRTVMRIDNLGTGKTKADGNWARFAVVTSGSGGKLSNQRALRENPYIETFTAHGQIAFLEGIEPEKVQRFLEFAGRDIGVGASRKMNWGRFTVAQFEEAT